MTKASKLIFNGLDGSEPTSPSSQQILEQAIQKAIDGGYRPNMDVRRNDLNTAESIVRWLIEENRTWLVLFDHDFAKALWPGYLGYIPGVNEDDDNVEEYWRKMGRQQEWSQDEGGPAFFKGLLSNFHLQQMVIADDPIKYLGENI